MREKDSFQVDLRVHGVSQDAVYNDQELQARYQTKSIINDLGKKGTFNMFSEVSRRTIKESGNIELFELGEISKTVQCPTCPAYSKRRNILLHMWFTPCAFARTDQKHKKLDLRSCLSLSVPCKKTTLDERNTEENAGSMTIAKQKHATRDVFKRSMAYRQTISKISMESRMDTRIL